MKKFSRVVDKKLDNLNKSDNYLNERKIMKKNILKLMSLLKIESCGKDINLYESNISISGKDMFADALLDLIQTNKINNQISILESIKSDVRDWKSIDSKIESLISINDKSIIENNIDKVSKLTSIIEIHQNSDLFDVVIDSYLTKLNKKDTDTVLMIVDRMILDDKYLEHKSGLKKIFNKIKENGNRIND